MLAIAEDRVPSTHEPDLDMHVFLDAGMGNVPPCLELPTKPEIGRDANTPIWVQHIAFKIKDRATLPAFRAHLEAEGVQVPAVPDHKIFHSIHILDPYRHRVEPACPDPRQGAKLARRDSAKQGAA